MPSSFTNTSSLTGHRPHGTASQSRSSRRRLDSSPWRRWAMLLLLTAASHVAGWRPGVVQAQPAETLPGTSRLTMEGDLASQMVDGVDRFLLRKLAESVAEREQHWNRDLKSPAAYTQSLEANRKVLAYRLGVADERVPFESPQLLTTVRRSSLVASTDRYEVHAVRWPTRRDISAYGLLVRPSGPVRACVVAMPDADQSPEQLLGLAPGIPASQQWARRLAESGCCVMMPALISRHMEQRNGRANLTHREFVYRSAFELGAHIVGFEVDAILSAVDWFQQDGELQQASVGVIGYGEGGMLALYAGALDPRIDSVCVSGYFGPREGMWNHPIDRNVFGLLERFGDAELAAMVWPRMLVVEATPGPSVSLPSQGGAPAELSGPEPNATRAEFQRALDLVRGMNVSSSARLTAPAADAAPGADSTLDAFLGSLDVELVHSATRPPRVEYVPDADERQRTLLEEYNRYTQWLLTETPFLRKRLFAERNTSSVEAFEASNEKFRQLFREEVIGHFPDDRLPLNPRTRLIEQTDEWSRYEVVLDVFPEVFAYGLLTIPSGINQGEKRPVVVCQHGLEGRPQDVIGEPKFSAYKAFATRLAERGFITFAPQNIYIFKDRFRTLQRKANPLKKTLFSIMVPQHQQIVDWLKTQPNVDGDRIAFYGLSYGGKSAMRIPALVTDYCLSICSADFNEWVRKNASTQHPFSYVWTGEYEIFEFDLGRTFNYAEMASLIAPRPFMVERGHFDGVGIDEWVAYEFAKVRFLYQAQLGLGDRCEIEWFVGPHTINGQATYDFLHRHLDWQAPAE